MYFLSFQLACFCSLCNFQLLYFSRRVSQTLCRVIFFAVCHEWDEGFQVLSFVLPSDYRLPLAGDLEIFWTYMVGGTMSWCKKPMRFWHLIMTLLKVKQGHFETPILVLLNFSSIITAKDVQKHNINIFMIQTLSTAMQLFKGSNLGGWMGAASRHF